MRFLKNYYVKRAIAFLIDYCFIGITALLTIFLISYIHSYILFMTIQIVMIAIAFCYEPFFISKFGTTVGKKIMNLYVVGEYEKKIHFKDGIVRMGSKILSTIIVGLGYVTIFTSKKNQAMHDKIAHTLVISKEEYNKITHKPRNVQRRTRSESVSREEQPVVRRRSAQPKTRIERRKMNAEKRTK